MTVERQQRIATLQHERRQRAVLDVLARLGASSVNSIGAAESIALRDALSSMVAELRRSGRMQRHKFAGVEEALETFLAPQGNLHSEGVWEFYGSEGAVGFFRGDFPRLALRGWVDAGHDGFALVMPDLTFGRLLDLVIDDTYEGTFVEVETWGDDGGLRNSDKGR